MIPKQAFGRTGHASTRVIFGAYALSQATQAEADRILALLLESGVNHLDMARSYGNAEKRIGPWMAAHRDDFFIATKTYNTYFYEPLEAQDAVDRAVHWVLGRPEPFLITAGDMRILPKVLEAARRFEALPSDADMAADVAALAIEPIFA